MVEIIAPLIMAYIFGMIVYTGILNDNLDYTGSEVVARVIWWPIYLVKFLLKSFWLAVSTW